MELAEVSEAYVPSGRIGWLSWIVMPLASVVAGVIAYIAVGIGSQGLALVWSSFSLTMSHTVDGRLPGVLRFVMHLVARFGLWIAIPSLLLGGATIPACILTASRLTKNRNRVFAAAAGIGSALIALCAVLFVDLPFLHRIEAQDPELLKGLGVEPSDVESLAELLRKNLWIKVPLLLGLAVFSASAGMGIGSMYFCEKCGQYLSHLKSWYWPSGTAQRLAGPILADDLKTAVEFIQRNPPSTLSPESDCVRVDIHNCPKCGRAVVNVYDSAYLTTDEEGEKQFNDTLRASIWATRRTARQMNGEWWA
jgi:hypothetical protein